MKPPRWLTRGHDAPHEPSWQGNRQDGSRIDAHRSSEAAIELLGKKIDGLLVTDAYASYNPSNVAGVVSPASAHLLRRSKDISEELASLTQTAALHGSHPLEMFRALFKSAAAVQDIIYGHPADACAAS